MRTAFGYLVAARRCEIRELEQLARTCELVRGVAELVHRLQCERGAANVFLASGGRHFGDLWEARAADSEGAQARVRDWLDRLELSESLAGAARLFSRIAMTLGALDELPAIRAAVRGQCCSPAQATERYSRLVGALLALVFEAADIAADPAASRLLVALFNLMQGKEFAGQERAAGAAAFAAGQSTAETVATLQHLIDLQEQCFARFASFCDEGLAARWQEAQQAMPMAEIERLRRKLMHLQGHLDAALADDWFACCSRRMDDIHRIEGQLATRLQQACERQVARKQLELEDHQATLAALPPDMAPPAALSLFVTGLEGVPGSDDELAGGAMGPRLARAIVEALQAQSRHLQAVSDELAAARASLDERKLVERAKGLLMTHQGLDEGAAYQLLRQQAMNRNCRLAEVAQAVLAMADFLPGRR